VEFWCAGESTARESHTTTDGKTVMTPHYFWNDDILETGKYRD
jgi:hypothetical protein